MERILRSKLSYFIGTAFIIMIIAYNFSTAKKQDTEVSEKLIHYFIENQDLENRASADKKFRRTKADSIVAYAHTLMGIPYKTAGKNTKGFDCSGFIYHVFNKHGVEVPAGSVNLYKLGISVLKKDLNKGDLVFFTGTDINVKEAGHVGIVISEPGDKTQFIHSSSGGGGRGVVINDLDHPHYEARYLGAKRIDLM